MNIGDRVWWKVAGNTILYGTVAVLEDRPGVLPDGDPDVLYLDADQLTPIGELGDGAHTNIPDSVYHAHPGLSSSGAKLLLPPSVPAKFKYRMDNPPPPKRHYDFGHLVHTLVLGKGADIEVYDFPDWRSKVARDGRDFCHANGLVPALKSEYEMAEKMTGAVCDHPAAGPLILSEGEAEVSLFATDPETGVRLRARPDWMTYRDGRLWIVDLKTCADGNPASFGRTAVKWGYQIQCAWYVTVAQMLGLDESPAFLFLLVEKEPPYLVSVVELDAEAFRLGREQMRQAIAVYQECTETGIWGGYGDEIHSLSLPPWAFASSGPTIGDLLEVE